MLRRKLACSKLHKERMKAAKTIYCLLALLLMVFWAIQCDDDGFDGKITVEPSAVIIFGIVVDSVTNLPVQAWAGFDSIFDSSLSIFTIADTLGYYRIPAHPAITRIFCSMDGYDTQMKEFQLNPGDSTAIDFKLVPR